MTDKELIKLAYQQVEAMQQALEALEASINVPCYGGHPRQEAAAKALREALANEALDKKAKNARELGLDYEPAQQEFVSPGGGYVPAIPAQQPAQQEPVAYVVNCTNCGEEKEVARGSHRPWCLFCGGDSFDWGNSREVMAEQPAPAWWPAVESILNEYGLQAIDFVADFKAAQQEPVAWVDLIKEADEIVRGKVLWKRFIDGTPLANDIACWMADFAQRYTSPPAQRTWVDPNDKTQKQYLPHIGEPVLFCRNGMTYTGKHTGGSFQSEITNQYFNTWECHWMYLPAAHGIKEKNTWQYM